MTDLPWVRGHHESGESGVGDEDEVFSGSVSEEVEEPGASAARITHLSGDSGIAEEPEASRRSERRRRTKSDDTASRPVSFRDEFRSFWSTRAHRLRRFADKELSFASVRHRSQSIAEEGEYSFQSESVQPDTTPEAEEVRQRRYSDVGAVPDTTAEGQSSPRKRSAVRQFFDTFRPRARSENQQTMQRPAFRKRRESGDCGGAVASSATDEQLGAIPQGRELQSAPARRRPKSPVGDLVTKMRSLGSEQQQQQQQQRQQRLPHPKDMPLDHSFCASMTNGRLLTKATSIDESGFQETEPGCSVQERHKDLFQSLHHADTEGQCSILSHAAMAESSSSSSSTRRRRMSGPALLLSPQTLRQRAASGGEVQVTENEKYIIFKSRCQAESSPDLQQLQEDCRQQPGHAFRLLAQQHKCYDLLPSSTKLLVFDTSLNVKKAFFALVYNGLRAAPLWDGTQQKFVGMLTVSDFIYILHSQHRSALVQTEELETHRISTWRAQLKRRLRPLQWISPEASLLTAVRLLLQARVHRLLAIDPGTGNALCIITHKRLLRFLHLHLHLLALPDWLGRSVSQLRVGTFGDIVTVGVATPLIRVLALFLQHRVSALPVLANDGTLQDIYSKFDVLNLAATKTYNNLDVSVGEALQYRKSRFEGVATCKASDSLKFVMEKLVTAEVHRLVVIDDDRRVTGIVSLSDVLQAVVLQPDEMAAA